MPNFPPLPITGTLAERLYLVRNGVPYEVARMMEVNEVANHVLALATLDDVVWDNRQTEEIWAPRDYYMSREVALLHNDAAQVYGAGALYQKRRDEARCSNVRRIAATYLGQDITPNMLERLRIEIEAKSGGIVEVTADNDQVCVVLDDGYSIFLGSGTPVQPATAST